MGIEVIIGTLAVVSAAASVTGGVMAYQDSKRQAKASARQGEILAKESERKSVKLMRAQRASFLASGLTLEGTPQMVLGETYTLGKQDISQIKDYYSTQAKSQLSAGRTALIGGIAKGTMDLASAGMNLRPAAGAGQVAPNVGSASVAAGLSETTTSSFGSSIFEYGGMMP